MTVSSQILVFFHLLLILQIDNAWGFEEPGSSKLECGDELKIGLEFYSFHNRNEMLDPYNVTGNPFFDPRKPTLIHIHGWTKGACKRQRKNTFFHHLEQFLLPSAKPKSPLLADLWLNSGWNTAIFNW